MRLLMLWEVLLSSSLLLSLASAQDDGGEMMEDDSSMMDPTLLMGGDGTGGNGGMGIGGGAMARKYESLQTQTLLAMQELGMVIGVAFMMGFIFLFIVYAEKLIDSLRRRFKEEEEEDVEAHPADLVGSFKRYKN